MPLLENGQIVCDPWLNVGDDEPLPGDTPAILSLARLRQDPTVLDGHDERLGVCLPRGTTVEQIADLLGRVALIVVPFEKFRDGRGFTLARVLREQYGYEGEIRAVGHLLPDQYEFLLRCGFNSVVLPDGADPAPWQRARERYDVAYQAAATPESPLSLLRRHVERSEAATQGK
jgi:uncharacterized protein (DUF934 family)